MSHHTHRAKDPYTDDFVSGYLVEDRDIKDRWYICWGYSGNFVDGPIIKPETIGRYTGVMDENRQQEICEGDIVDVGYGSGIVVYHAGCFMIQWIDDKEANMELLSMKDFKRGHTRDVLKIIGNIHDNPELMQL